MTWCGLHWSLLPGRSELVRNLLSRQVTMSDSRAILLRAHLCSERYIYFLVTRLMREIKNCSLFKHQLQRCYRVQSLAVSGSAGTPDVTIQLSAPHLAIQSTVWWLTRQTAKQQNDVTWPKTQTSASDSWGTSKFVLRSCRQTERTSRLQHICTRRCLCFLSLPNYLISV